MAINTVVDFKNLRREGNGNVAGTVRIRVHGSVVGKDFDQTLEDKDFNFPRNGEQEVYNKEIGLGGGFSIKLTAKCYENTSNQCCVRGHIHIDAPIGGGIGADLDPNCHDIP